MSIWLIYNTLVAHIKIRHSKRKIIVIVCAPECALVRANRTSDFKAPQLFEEAIYRCCSNFGGLIRSDIKECITVSNQNNKNQCIPKEVLTSFLFKFQNIDLELLIQVTCQITIKFKPLDTGEVVTQLISILYESQIVRILKLSYLSLIYTT